MTDLLEPNSDPTTILSAAGVSVPEVEAYTAKCVKLTELQEMCDVAETVEWHADAAILAISERFAERVAELDREVALRDRVIDAILEDQRAVDLYYLVPDARLGDIADVKHHLLARYAEEVQE